MSLHTKLMEIHNNALDDGTDWWRRPGPEFSKRLLGMLEEAAAYGGAERETEVVAWLRDVSSGMKADDYMCNEVAEDLADDLEAGAWRRR